MGSLAPDNSPAPDNGEPVSRNHIRFIKVKCQIQSADYEIDEQRGVAEVARLSKTLCTVKPDRKSDTSGNFTFHLSIERGHPSNAGEMTRSVPASAMCMIQGRCGLAKQHRLSARCEVGCN